MEKRSVAFRYRDVAGPTTSAQRYVSSYTYLHMSNTNRKPDRRAERSKQAILDTTRELLAEEGGVRALTVEAVAARSGVAKTTIYRRWRDKWELALDAVMIDMLPRFADPVDVGDTRKELITFVDSVMKFLSTRPFGPAMQGLVSEIATEPKLGRVYREQVVEPRRRQLAPVIERGIARGDLRPDTDLRILHELLLGPLFYRLLLSGGPLDRKLSTRLVDAVLEGFATAGGGAPKSTRRLRR
jgi:AcrR family transcriptional regulator